MLPEVEGLEHHGQARTPATQLPFVNGGQAAIPVRSQHQLFAAEPQATLVGLFEQVQATQEGALSRTA